MSPFRSHSAIGAHSSSRVCVRPCRSDRQRFGRRHHSCDLPPEAGPSSARWCGSRKRRWRVDGTRRSRSSANCGGRGGLDSGTISGAGLQGAGVTGADVSGTGARGAAACGLACRLPAGSRRRRLEASGPDVSGGGCHVDTGCWRPGGVRPVEWWAIPTYRPPRPRPPRLHPPCLRPAGPTHNPKPDSHRSTTTNQGTKPRQVRMICGLQ